jgi:hypothetical protein
MTDSERVDEQADKERVEREAYAEIRRKLAARQRQLIARREAGLRGSWNDGTAPRTPMKTNLPANPGFLPKTKGGLDSKTRQLVLAMVVGIDHEIEDAVCGTIEPFKPLAYGKRRGR